MRVKNKISGEIVEMTQNLFERNKKFFVKITNEPKPAEAIKKFNIEDYKKSEIIDFILEKTEDYSIDDLNNFKKNELVEMYKGEL